MHRRQYHRTRRKNKSNIYSIDNNKKNNQHHYTYYFYILAWTTVIPIIGFVLINCIAFAAFLSSTKSTSLLSTEIEELNNNKVIMTKLFHATSEDDDDDNNNNNNSNKKSYNNDNNDSNNKDDNGTPDHQRRLKRDMIKHTLGINVVSGSGSGSSRNNNIEEATSSLPNVEKLTIQPLPDGTKITTRIIGSSSSTQQENEEELQMKTSSHHSMLPSSYNGRTSLYLFSRDEYNIPQNYDFDVSTQENYNNGKEEFYGPFKEIRSSLDYNYHGNYSKHRQQFQDKIVEKLLDGVKIHDTMNGRVCKTPTHPWIVFTAGVMGAGKSHTMKQVSSKGFPLESYIVIDPDETRSHFPEYHMYARRNPMRAGELTHREAGYVTEIATVAALKLGYNVLVDGSLWDYKWYEEYFRSLRKEYKLLRIAIIHITAPREAVFARAVKRAKDTGRVVPTETLEKSLEQVPISVKKLAPLADFFCELDNSGAEVILSTEGVTWESFKDNWVQTCPWDPPDNRSTL